MIPSGFLTIPITTVMPYYKTLILYGVTCAERNRTEKGYDTIVGQLPRLVVAYLGFSKG